MLIFQRLTFILGLLFVCPNFGQALDPRPNIVLIMADDLGYDDLGSYGSTFIQTPRLDVLAQEGMRFTDYHTAGAVCSPTRASILTGEYPLKFGITRAYADDEVRGIPASVSTLPEKLRSLGYLTSHVGKWHLGRSNPEYAPFGFGFNDTWEWKPGSDSYVNFTLSRNGGAYVPYTNGEYLTEVLTDKAIEFISQNVQRPFFLNLWHFTPHSPHHVPVGYDNSNTAYPLGTRRGKYAAMVTHLDTQVGRVLDAINALGLRDRTVVIFVSDNGAEEVVVSPQTALRGYKQDMFEGGIRVPMIIRWPGVIPAGSTNHTTAMSFDLFTTIYDLAGGNISKLKTPGISLVDALRNNFNLTRSKSLYWEIENARDPSTSTTGTNNDFAVRAQDWKYVSQDGQPYLFNMREDPSEANNLISTYSALAHDLKKKHTSWRLTTGLFDFEKSYSKGKIVPSSQGWTFKKDLGVVKANSPFISRVGGGELSIVFSLRSDLTNGERVIFQNSGIFLRMINRRLLLSLTDTEATTVTLTGPKLEKGKTYRIAMTVFTWRSGSLTARLFVNGKQVAEETKPRAILAISDAALVFGNRYGAKKANKSFRGVISKLKMYTLSLTPDEIISDYKKYKGL
ncbi:MAG: sulfatase-like hydrolase/transferase [Oligoflexia bacterium]|nr:sulfatase-like hydrolase/transferase [Oligoflexia bacterium]